MEHQQKKLLQGIDTMIVRVSNLENARNWYCGKLDLVPVWQDELMNLLVLDTNGPTSLTLWQTDKPIVANHETASYPIFKTTNANELWKQLHERGIFPEKIIQDEFVKYFFFYDPDGNVLEACEVVS